MTAFAKMNCSVACALGEVGERWSLLIVREAIMGATRFEAFHAALGIARNILTDRLNALVLVGVLDKTASRQSARIFDYRLTEKGWDLYGVVAALMHWGDRWLPQESGAPVIIVDKRTGEPVPRVTLRRGEAPDIPHGELLIVAGPGANERTRRRLRMPSPTASTTSMSVLS
jgi:DNA-binding HxlR family transcriptional regulator